MDMWLVNSISKLNFIAGKFLHIHDTMNFGTAVCMCNTLPRCIPFVYWSQVHKVLIPLSFKIIYNKLWEFEVNCKGTRYFLATYWECGTNSPTKGHSWVAYMQVLRAKRFFPPVLMGVATPINRTTHWWPHSTKVKVCFRGRGPCTSVRGRSW